MYVFHKNEALDVEATKRGFAELTATVNEFLRSQNAEAKAMTPEEVAEGFINVANEAMCRPIRSLTQVRGCVCLVLEEMFVFFNNMCVF